jgi:hypothetical protein
MQVGEIPHDRRVRSGADRRRPAPRQVTDEQAVADACSTGGPYNNFRRSLADWYAQTYAGPPHNVAGRLAISADDVAAVITRAATSRHPRARYPVGTLARALFLLRRWLPGPAFDAFLRTQFPAP